MNITDGGYDDGYEAVQCFWGVEPGSLVADYLERHTQKLRSARALDLGCGEGSRPLRSRFEGWPNCEGLE